MSPEAFPVSSASDSSSKMDQVSEAASELFVLCRESVGLISAEDFFVTCMPSPMARSRKATSKQAAKSTCAICKREV